jgi:hypothetical protein
MSLECVRCEEKVDAEDSPVAATILVIYVALVENAGFPGLLVPVLPAAEQITTLTRRP